MSKIIVLYNYSKYYNRIEKKLPTFEAYQALITPADENTPAQLKGFVRTKVNFDYEDGVHASLVINIAKNEDLIYKVDQPDYLVLETEYKEGQTTVKQLSRWFILESVKVRGNQWELSLRRDMISDYYDEVKQAPVFIERGTPSNIDDPIIFNREGFTYNQIKKKELLLNFNKLSGKGRGWIVGYLAREDGDGNVTQITDAVGHAEIPEGVLQWTDIPASIQDLITNQYGYFSQTNSYHINMLLRVNNRASGDVNDYREYRIENWDNNVNNSVSYGPSLYTFPGRYPYTYFKKNQGYAWYLSDVCNYIAPKDKQANTALGIGSKTQAWYSSLSLQHRFNDKSIISQYNGIVYQKDGHLYRLTISSRGISYTNYLDFTPTQLQAGSGSNPTLSTALNSYINNYIRYNNSSTEIIEDIDVHNNLIALSISKPEEEFSFVSEISEFDEVKASIPDTRNENLDAPYDLFCIPIGPVSVKSNGITVLTNVENTAVAMARGIAVKGTTSIVYDIQILPYCPFEEIINSDGDIEIYGFSSDVDYSYITKEENGSPVNVGIIIYPKSCRGTFDMSIPSNSDAYSECLEETNSIMEKKIKAETKLCRFVSPNFASIFEINVQKNKGIVNLNVDYYYKPYAPYIHVAPYFNGLYGQDFNDPKGLICSGDFSIATASSKWEEYQIANKNYELIFNRQLQNLDVNNSIAYQQLEITGKLGVASSALSGMAAGAMTGAVAGSAAGPWGTAIGAVGGAVVGGVTSGVASSIGAKKDLEFLSKQQREARSYMKDMYTYSLGNIQALPVSLTKVSTFTENNKIFPFIEFYDSTDEEKEALRNKIIYNGMTIMRIGRIMDFIGQESKYVQGQLIRLVGINEDSHVIAEIANEIGQGAYYYGTDSE